MARKKLVIKGLVVGVGFRAHALYVGTELGLNGWVKNRRDARVEALVEGDDAKVAEFVEWCKKGPGSARVTGVEETDDTTEDPLGPFAIRPTG